MNPTPGLRLTAKTICFNIIYHASTYCHQAVTLPPPHFPYMALGELTVSGAAPLLCFIAQVRNTVSPPHPKYQNTCVYAYQSASLGKLPQAGFVPNKGCIRWKHLRRKLPVFQPWPDGMTIAAAAEPVPGPLLSLGRRGIRFTFFPHKHLSHVTQKSDQQTWYRAIKFRQQGTTQWPLEERY